MGGVEKQHRTGRSGQPVRWLRISVGERRAGNSDPRRLLPGELRASIGQLGLEALDNRTMHLTHPTLA